MGMMDAFFSWRNRLVANPGFQRQMASLPITRPVAQRSAASVFDLCAGFVYSQVLLACVELNLLETVRERPMRIDTLASTLGLPPAGMERLVKAAVAIGLLRAFSQDRYGLGFRGAALMANPSVFDMVRHHALLYRDLSDPVALLRNPKGDTELSRYWGYATSGDPSALETETVADYTGLMASTQRFIAEEVVAAYDFSPHSRLLDIGGGGGAFLQAIAARYPGMELGLFDLPAVTERAKERLNAEDLLGEDLAERIAFHGGNFFADSLPSGYDVITLVRILHDHDENDVSTLLRRIRDVLPDGGSLVIAEPQAGTPGAKAMGDAYFGMYLWAMGSGAPRTFETLKDLLENAGFSNVRRHRTRQPLLTQVVTAR